MKKPFFLFAGLLAATVLVGQGCEAAQRTDLRVRSGDVDSAESSEAKIDAAVNAILDDSEEEADENAKTEEQEIYEDNGVDLDAYVKTEYEIE